jgi:hypothetical protein
MDSRFQEIYQEEMKKWRTLNNYSLKNVTENTCDRWLEEQKKR